jgi:glycosyltransferase involved in cell wall biosynthesis
MAKMNANFDAIFYCTSDADADALKLVATDLAKKQRILPSHLSVRKTEFCDSPKRRLFYASTNWDRRRGKLYVPLYRMLDKTGYFDAYGPEANWNGKVKNSYRGYLTHRNDELLAAAQKAGIVLVLHLGESIRNGAQSSRVFEAAAASAVIISGWHPFVRKHFGDSVLYVNQNANPRKMFKQINGHVEWILANQGKALELARRSHAIFVENFPLELDADKIAKTIREIVAENAAKVG